MKISSIAINQTIDLLKKMIATTSFSKEEENTADLISTYLSDQGVSVNRYLNNVWATNKHFDSSKPTLLLNSHHDTVLPNPGYTRDPFEPSESDGKLYGLGSNDAGGALVSLIATFVHFHGQGNLKYNLVLAATAEEEISGKNGIECILSKLPKLDLAIVGEPTLMDMAIAEKGLMVLDCKSTGVSGHAARNEGENALYKALKDISWIQSFEFEKTSPTLGPIKMTTTIIKAGSQHNVVPAECDFTVDVRSTDAYSNEELLAVIRENLDAQVTARSLRLRPSSIAPDHPLIQAGRTLGRGTYGSPTTSDQAVIPVTSLKMGPGDSARSHSADEFIYLSEIEDGINTYIAMLGKIM